MDLSYCSRYSILTYMTTFTFILIHFHHILGVQFNANTLQAGGGSGFGLYIAKGRFIISHMNVYIYI
jgi:uncharacterized membrane protein (DUF485 family)